jgi:hypothetical protein
VATSDAALSSAAAAIGKEYFWEGIERLQHMGFDAQMLSIGKEYFWRGIEWLQRMGFHAQKLVTFMCNSVAKRLDKECFWRGIEMLGKYASARIWASAPAGSRQYVQSCRGGVREGFI